MTTFADNASLSDGPAGVAPRSGPIRLLVEGWTLRPHSYSLVNMHQCLALLRRGDVDLYRADHPLWANVGTDPMEGLLSPIDTATVEAIPYLPKGQAVDAVYRIGYPYNFAPGPARTFVFATCECMNIRPDSWVGGTGPVGTVIEQNDITVITPSQWSRRGFIASGVDPARVVVVPHGVDTRLFAPLPPGEREDARKALGCDERFVFLNISALTGNKNVGAVIEAFGRVVQKHPRALLVIKGMDAVYESGKWLQVELGSVEAFARWKATKNMAYVGSVADYASIARMYQTADCYVSPYKAEGFNLPVLEASACGLPVIVPEGGCTDDFLPEGGALKLPGQIGDHHGDGNTWIRTAVDDLEAAMQTAITDASVRDRARAEGPVNAAKFTWDSAASALIGVVAATLKGSA